MNGKRKSPKITDLPNIGGTTAAKLEKIGIRTPEDRGGIHEAPSPP
jgi:hypothetical protein